MSDLSIFRRHRDFFWAALFAICIAALAQASIIKSTSIPIALAGTVFLGVIAGVGTMIVIFKNYDKVINKAQEIEMFGVIRQVFIYPLIASVVGILYLILINSLVVDLSGISLEQYSGLVEIISQAILAFLIAYAVLSLAEGISFLWRVMVGEA